MIKLGDVVNCVFPDGKYIGTVGGILTDDEGETYYYVFGNSSYIHATLVSLHKEKDKKVTKEMAKKILDDRKKKKE